MSGADLDVWFRVVGRRGTHPLLDLAGHGQEGLLDVACILRRGLKERDSQAVGEFLKATKLVIRRSEDGVGLFRYGGPDPRHGT